MNWRQDVHGLRGIAVVLVVLYHARLHLFQGGYIGVDVFLVISGFVITGMLIRQFECGRFNIAGFYLGRLRRLMPASVSMVLVTLAAGGVMMGPHDLTVLAQSALASVAFASNFFFWRHHGYFEGALSEQPLLHTWSLGLEEQFYLFYPIFLLLMYRAGRAKGTPAIALVALLSLGLGIFLAGYHSAAAFYLIPGRLWQFLVGALVAISPRIHGVRSPTGSPVALACIVAILVGAAEFSGRTPYPGLAALLPTMATGGLIWVNGGSRNLAMRMLALPPFQYLGAISYSLYLWHWPILALSRYYLARELTPLETTAALAATLAISHASWVHLERRYRSSAGSSLLQPSLAPIAAAAVLVVSSGVLLVFEQGVPRRVPQAALAFDPPKLAVGDTSTCHHGPPERIVQQALCSRSPPVTGGSQIALWGDSHANAIAPALAELAALRGFHLWQATYSSCPPVLGLRIAYTTLSHHCKEFNDAVIYSLARTGVRRVILAAYWSFYLDGQRETAIARLLDPFTSSGELGAGDRADNERLMRYGLRRTVQALEDAGIEVWILRQVPDQHAYVPLILSRAAWRGIDPDAVGISRAEYRRDEMASMTVFSAMPGAVHLLDPASVLCETGRCRCSEGTMAIYVDSNHLSPFGAMRLRSELLKFLH